MVPTTALVPVVLLLALGADAAPSQDRRSWGNRRQGTRVLSARAAATTTTRANGDLQTFNQGLGSVYAPPVTASNGQFYQSNVPYYFLYDALVASCNQQSNNCAISSAVSPLDKVNCYGSQSLACISNAQTAANAYSASAGAAASSSAKAYSSSAAAFSSSAAAYSSSSAAAYSASASAASANAVSWSSSVASANYAKATQARSAAGDVQTFTGALGGIAAPAVTASGSKWISSGVTYNFLKDALDGSCYWQMNACQLAANNGGNKLELTVANCNGPQIQACLGAETAIISAQGAAATSSAAAWSASQSAQAYSASQSAQAYSASQSAQAYSASASAYSYSSSVSAAAAKASSAPVSSTSKPASSSSASSSAAPTSSAASSGGSSTTTAGNFQAFTGAIGGAAPAVTQNSQGQFVQSGITYGSLLTALQQSCYFQQNTCGTSSSVSDKTPCYTSQINACLTSAQSLSDSYTKSAVSYSSSVASANYAAATAARTVAGDVQSFTGAVGGIAAPAVTGSLQNWWSNNIYYYNLIDALSASCYYQQAQCNAKVAQNGGDSYEVTIDNCNNVQLNACLNNAKSVVSNYGKSSSSAPASSTSSSSAANTASASAYSASSLAAYSSSVNAANNAQAQQSASAYSQSSASAYSASSAAAYSQSVQNAQNAQAQQSASAYSASSASAYSQSSAAAYSQSVQNAQAQQSASAYSASSASAYSQSSAAAYSQSVQNAQAQQSASAYSQSSLAAYSQSVQNAQAQQSASAYSASSASAYSQSSAAAYSQSVQNAQAQQSASAYSASSAAAAYSASVSAAAYSASSAAAAAVPTGLPSGWSQASTACIAEGTTGRALISDATFGNDMTWAKCTSYCDSKGYPLAGIEYSSECYCGNVLSNGASLNRPSAQCTMNAAGSNGQQIGGGPNALTLFVSNKLDTSKYTADLSGMIAQIPNGWTSTTGDSGICIIEGNTGRALAAASFAADDMTIAKCINFCSGKGMQYAGLEYSRECYCGNDLVNGASKDKTASCNMQCAGAPGTICGGPALLSVYQSPNLVYTATSVNGFQHQGCIQEVAGRALNQLSTVGNDMSIEKCTSFCAQNGYSFAGLEYASECYCGNSLANGATLGAFSTQCNMQCSGNNQETCGGPNAITLYATQQGLALVGA